LRIEVRLFATLAEFLPRGGERGVAVVDVPDDATVDAVTRTLGIPATLPSIVLVNGRDAEPDDRLAPGDVLTMFPPLAGG
jgi:sulfur-carrier protein